MQGTITTAVTSHTHNLIVDAQGGFFDQVRLLSPQGIVSLAQQNQQAFLLTHSPAGALGVRRHFALAVGQAYDGASVEPGSTHVFSRSGGAKILLNADDSVVLQSSSGAQITLSQDGDIVLQPASGRHLTAEKNGAKKQLVLYGDRVSIGGQVRQLTVSP